MPEDSRDTQGSLNARAAALVADRGGGAERNGGPPAIDFDSLAAEAVETLVSSPDPGPEGGLAGAVEQLVSAPTPAASTEPPKIEALDAQIATMADDLIAGEIRDEHNQVRGQVGAAPVESPAAPAPAPNAPTPASPTPAPAKAPEPLVFDTPLAPRPTPVAPPPAQPRPQERPRKLVPRATVERTARAAAELRPVAVGLLSILAAPLRNKPKYVRDTIGWVALVTLFNATCLWGYVLLLRSPTPSAPAAAVEGEGHSKADPHVKPDSHAKADSHAKDDGHKAPPKKAAAKKPEKKSSKKDKAQASHGGGH